MHIHVYKKRTESCKFLLGLAELPMKPIFDRVKREFDLQNINWEDNVMTHVSRLPRIRGPCKKTNDCVTCYEKHRERREQWCPTSELTKRMLPLFNLCKMQTGNIVRIPRVNRDPITQVIESRSAVLGSHTDNLWNYEEIEHENGLNC